MSFIQSVLKIFVGNLLYLVGFIILLVGILMLFLTNPWWYGLIVIILGVLFFSISTALRRK